MSDQKIAEDLEDLRMLVVHLMDRRIQDVLWEAWRCTTRPEVIEWELAAQQAVMKIAEAEIEPVDPHPWADSPRAHCLLCGAGTQQGNGYAIPLGLDRHLRRECPVIKVLRRAALDAMRQAGRRR